MSAILSALSALLVLAGAFFFTAGTAGVLRFPDVHSRLHALTKADNLGLGFIALGLALRAEGPWQAAKLVLVWLLVVLAAATTAQLVARLAMGERAETPEGVREP